MKNHLYALLLLAVLSVAAYANALGNYFVWDDDIFIVSAKEIRTLDIPRFFTEGTQDLYRPLRTTLYALTYRYGGLDPVAYHLVGKTMNILTIGALYALLFLLFESVPAAFLGALIFALHPVHTEKVTFITSTYDIPADFLWLAAFALYVWHRKRQPPFAFTVSLALFGAGLFFAENAAVLPLVVVLYDLTFGAGDRKPLRWVPHFAVLAFYLIVRTAVLGSVARGGGPTLNPDLLGNLLTMSGATFVYAKLLLIPWPLSATYSWIRPAVAPYPPYLWAAFAIIVIGLAAAWRQREARPWVAFAAFWFFAVIAPNLNFIPTRGLFAERYLYLPSASLSFAAAAGYLLVMGDSRRRNAYVAGIVGVALLFGGLTVLRNRDWRDQETLWITSMRRDPGAFTPLVNLSDIARDRGNNDFAERLLRRAIEVQPGMDLPLIVLADFLAEEGRYAEALPLYEKAYGLVKKDNVLLSIGITKLNLGQVAAAEAIIMPLLEKYPAKSRTNQAYGALLYFKNDPLWWGPFVKAWGIAHESAPLELMANAWLSANRPDAAEHIARFGSRQHPQSKALLALAAGGDGGRPAGGK